LTIRQIAHRPGRAPPANSLDRRRNATGSRGYRPFDATVARPRAITFRSEPGARRSNRQSALADPVGFVSFHDLLVIDEIQRAPEMLLAIKVTVDADPRPGRFLLTGSARLLGLRALPDTLPGRMETIELWPFSQGEIDRTTDSFIDAAFTLGPGLHHESTVSRAD